jgi:hemoglobin
MLCQISAPCARAAPARAPLRCRAAAATVCAVSSSSAPPPASAPRGCPFGFGRSSSATPGAAAGAIGDTSLLARLGGDGALTATLNKFYSGLTKDPLVERFFKGVNMPRLQAHQFDFLSLAFTEIPKDYDVAAYMAKGHARLLKDGLDAEHFDVVATHLVGALNSLEVPPPLVDEVVTVVSPLRAMFAKNAADYRAQQKK